MAPIRARSLELDNQAECTTANLPSSLHIIVPLQKGGVHVRPGRAVLTRIERVTLRSQVRS